MEAAGSQIPQDATVRQKPAKSPLRRLFDILSGFGLATILLLLLGLLTWLATLEQVEYGLVDTLKRYFDINALFVVPRLHGKDLPLVLPGGYWVCALLFLNLLLGGILRARRGWKHVGALISHSAILFLLAAGAVSHRYEIRGNMAIGEGETSDVAEDYLEHVVEIAEIKNGKPENIHVIRSAQIEPLKGTDMTTFRLPEFPFDIQLKDWFSNAQPVAITERAPEQGEPDVDGYYLVGKPNEKQGEKNTPACHGRILERDGTTSPPFIVAAASYHPFTLRHGDRIFTVDMHKRYWPMPFSVRLDKFTAEFHPGTNRPGSFVSEITRIENGKEAAATIQMNEPMRYEGLTFFQASYGPPDARPGQKLYSVFEVVHNPADQWPRYSLYVVAFGLFLHFIIKLVIFSIARFSK